MGWRLTVADFIPPFPMVSTGVSLPCFVIHLSWQSLNNGMNSQVWRNWTFQITVGSSLFTLLALKIKLWKFLFVDGCCADFTNSVLGWYLRDWCLVPFFFHVFVKHKSWEYEPLSWEYQPLNFSKTLILFPKNGSLPREVRQFHIPSSHLWKERAEGKPGHSYPAVGAIQIWVIFDTTVIPCHPG